MSDTYVRPGTTKADRAERLKQRSVKFVPRRERGSRLNRRLAAIRESEGR